MNKYNPESKAIAILGMHRSGTSAITRAMNILGVYLGVEDELMPPTSDNPKGYWERNDIRKINERIFNSYKRFWHTSAPLPYGWQHTEEANFFKKEIISLVNEKFAGRKLWAWKDPRASLTFELWKEALKALNIGISVLFVMRNPLDVANSLKKRDGFPQDKSFGIWFNYNLTALLATADLPRVFISYDRFLEDWETEMKRCALGLGIEWPEDEIRLKEEINRFIRPGLCHSKSGSGKLAEAIAPRPLIELYGHLSDLMDKKITTRRFNDNIEKMGIVLSEYSRFFQYDGLDLWDTINSWSWKMTDPLRGGQDIKCVLRKIKSTLKWRLLNL